MSRTTTYLPFGTAAPLHASLTTKLYSSRLNDHKLPTSPTVWSGKQNIGWELVVKNACCGHFHANVHADAHVGLHDAPRVTHTKQLYQLTCVCSSSFCKHSWLLNLWNCKIRLRPTISSFWSLRSQNLQGSLGDQTTGSRMPSGYRMMARVGSLPSNLPALDSTVD